MKAELKEVADTILAGMDRGFKMINGRMDNFEARLVTIGGRLKNVEERLTPIERRLSNVEDIRDDLNAALRATDTHAVQLIDHNKRIGRLEKRAT